MNIIEVDWHLIFKTFDLRLDENKDILYRIKLKLKYYDVQ